MTLFLCVVASVQGAAMSEAQKREVIAKINKTTASLKTMQCSFTQTKHLSMLNDKMVSEGKMYYRQPDKLRWEYVSPYKYLFIFNGAKVYVGNKSRKDVIDTNSNKLFKEVARIMMSTVTGKALSNTADFNITLTADAKSYHVMLVPKKKDLRKMMNKVELVFSRTADMISEINIFENNGDHTNIKLKNIVTNKEVNETLFAIP